MIFCNKYILLNEVPSQLVSMGSVGKNVDRSWRAEGAVDVSVDFRGVWRDAEEGSDEQVDSRGKRRPEM